MIHGGQYLEFAGEDLTLKDLRGRKQFKNYKQVEWTFQSLWKRLFSCGMYPKSKLDDRMTWVNDGEII